MIRIVTWDYVEDTARSLFNIWMHGRELSWARDAWKILADAGLTQYSTELERCEVYIRLMVLASVYRDWCALADDENQDDELTWWASELDISSFRLGQLVGSDFGEEEKDEDELLSTALGHLTAEARPEVVAALKKSYGGDNGLFLGLWRICNPAPPEPKPKQITTPASAALSSAPQSTLFPDLEALTSQPSLFDAAPADTVVRGEEGEQDEAEGSDDASDEELGSYEDDWAVLNHPTDQKLRAYEWISEGCPNVR